MIAHGVGLRSIGERDVLGVCVGDRENQHAWEEVPEDRKDRGVKRMRLWVTAGNKAMRNAIAAMCAESQRPRCVLHKIEKGHSPVPRKQREQVEPERQAIFYQESREKADLTVTAFLEKDQQISPTAIACLQGD